MYVIKRRAGASYFFSFITRTMLYIDNGACSRRLLFLLLCPPLASVWGGCPVLQRQQQRRLPRWGRRHETARKFVDDRLAAISLKKRKKRNERFSKQRSARAQTFQLTQSKATRFVCTFALMPTNYEPLTKLLNALFYVWLHESTTICCIVASL